MNRLLSIPLFMVGLGVVEGSWGGWWLGVVGVGHGTTFALPKMCPQTYFLIRYPHWLLRPMSQKWYLCLCVCMSLCVFVCVWCVKY